MATVILGACPGYRTRCTGYESITSQPFDRVGEHETVELSTVTAIRGAVAVYGAHLKARYPDTSFLVLVHVARGRKPNGFDVAVRGNGLGSQNWLELRDGNLRAAAVIDIPTQGSAAG